MKKILFSIFIFLFLTLSVSALEVELDRCIDGDTARFITQNGSESTRFLALDTPETVHPNRPVELYGKEASEFTCNKLTNADIIRLEFDDNSDIYDRYDRLLAWVFVDDVLLQELIVKEGYGEVAYLFGDYKYTDVLLEAEEYAKANQLNIWSDYEEEVIDFDISYLGALYIIIFISNVIYFKFKPYNKSTINQIYNRKKYINLFLLFYFLSIVFVLSDFAILIDRVVKVKNKIIKTLNQ